VNVLVAVNERRRMPGVLFESVELSPDFLLHALSIQCLAVAGCPQGWQVRPGWSEQGVLGQIQVQANVNATAAHGFERSTPSQPCWTAHHATDGMSALLIHQV
jgi:hypothetical protein